jgi:hypothetical protein
VSDTTTTPAETPAPAQPAPEQPKPQAPAATTAEPQRDAADQLGDAGKRAIKAERDRAESAERKFKDQQAAIAKALGIEQDKGEDIVSNLQQRLSAMEKTNLVNEVARRHGITEDDDIALLRNQPDEQGMALLASRLKSTTPTQPPAPAPDPSQASAPMSEAAAAEAAYAAFFPSKT